jgi:hypothetical protein
MHPHRRAADRQRHRAQQRLRLSNQRSVFHYAREAGLGTAAAAYHWISELYNRSPFDPLRDRHTDAPKLPIQHGLFYWNDHYPDSHLLADAENLRRATHRTSCWCTR